jgi:hypothetical protein
MCQYHNSSIFLIKISSMRANDQNIIQTKKSILSPSFSQSFVLSSLLFLTVVALLFTSPAHANFKCKNAEGKVEYSDRPCGEPFAAATAAPSKPSASLDRLNTLISTYDAKLCEREKLASEVDRASRAGIASGPEWKAKQTTLRDLNDELVAFQDKAGKLARAAGPESPEAQTLRKFQLKLKECSKLKKL